MAQVLTVRRSMWELLYQDEVWRPQGSEASVALEAMTPSHRLNLARWLIRNAKQAVFSEYSATERMMIDPWMSDTNQMLFEGETYRLWEIWSNPDPRAAKNHIRATPLFRRLNKLIRRDFAVARDHDPLEVTF